MKELLAQKTKEIESIIYPFYSIEGGDKSELSAAMEYALKSGGKRLRPMMMRESALLFGEIPDALPVFMASMEIIHNYSLVHDDLPAMDNDLLRHGKASTFAKFGESMGILAGDGLLNLAYEMIFTYLLKHPGQKIIEAANILSRSAGACGMVGGQAVDVMFDDKEITPSIDDINYIYENKCGKLIMASLMIGGVLSDADIATVKKLEKIGFNIGFAFQIVDDILDIKGDEKLLGKPIGSDEKNKKCTFVTKTGLKESEVKVRELTDEAIEILMTLPGDKSFLKELFTYLIERKL